MTERGRVAAARMAAVLAIALASPATFARDPLVGSWAGRWSRGGETLDLALVIRPGDLEGVPVASARHDGCCGVRLVLRADAAATHLRAAIHGGELRGTSAEDGGGRGTFTLHRASQPGEATR